MARYQQDKVICIKMRAQICGSFILVRFWVGEKRCGRLLIDTIQIYVQFNTILAKEKDRHHIVADAHRAYIQTREVEIGPAEPAEDGIAAVIKIYRSLQALNLSGIGQELA